MSHPRVGLARKKYDDPLKKSTRVGRSYRFGNEDQNRLLATELKRFQQNRLQARRKTKRRMYVGRANFIMILFSMMANQAYACAAFWTCGAEMSLAMCKCINSSMDAYLGTLEERNGAVKVPQLAASAAEHGHSADVIPFPLHRKNSSRPR